MRNVKANLPLKLDGSKNTRDLGGYPTLSGNNTASGVFLRSDDPSKFTESDVERLYDYGVRLVVDFRSDSEANAAPSALKGYRDIEYINPQMIDNLNANAPGDSPSMAVPATLGEMYVDFLDNKRHTYLEVFKAVLRHEGDCIFFNCTAGKDRAGTFAMLLLMLAEVPEEVVIIDYAASGDNVREDMDRLLTMYEGAIDEDMLRSRPAHMQKAIAHLNATYGGIVNWLKLAGLDDAEIAKLKNMLLGNF